MFNVQSVRVTRVSEIEPLVELASRSKKKIVGEDRGEAGKDPSLSNHGQGGNVAVGGIQTRNKLILL